MGENKFNKNMKEKITTKMHINKVTEACNNKDIVDAIISRQQSGIFFSFLLFSNIAKIYKQFCIYLYAIRK